MITFWADATGSFGIEDYLTERGRALRDRFTVHRYTWNDVPVEVPAGPHVFSALDQLTREELEGVTALRGQLAQAVPRELLLNDPSRCLLRPELLSVLADHGINSFRAYPAQRSPCPARFPVFVRGAYDHGGSATGLLRTPEALRRALVAMRLRGFRLADLLVVEFCDTSDKRGLFRKYSAFRIGQAIVPAHLLAGRNWMMKSATAERTRELARENLAFIEENPHEAWLRQVFALAGVEYGRVDYGILGDRPQLWEINLIPPSSDTPAVLPALFNRMLSNSGSARGNWHTNASAKPSPRWIAARHPPHPPSRCGWNQRCVRASPRQRGSA